jgi:8-oxo-dGTP pyrophosphatase MutT (NUDIX family)
MFNNLWQLSDVEKGDIAGKVFDVVSRAEESALIDKATALKELRQSSKLTGIFTNITDEMVTEAENEPPPMPETMGTGEVDSPEEMARIQQMNGAEPNVESDARPDDKDPDSDNPLADKPVDNPSGNERGKVVQKDTAIRAAGICVVDHSGKILLLKRSSMNDDHVGEWAFPGGKIESGETAVQTALREVREETGLRINSSSIIPLKNQSIDGFLGFITKPTNPVGKLEINEESDKLVWAEPSQLPSPMHPGAEQMIKSWFGK